MIELRRMTLMDVPGVLEVEQGSFSTPWSEEAFLFELDNPLAIYLVAIKDRQVAGYGGFRFILDQADVTNIAVRSDFRRQGIGSLILESLIKQALVMGSNLIYLEVRPSNIQAITLYKAYGFAETGLRKGYYEDPREDALLLSLSLKEGENHD